MDMKRTVFFFTLSLAAMLAHAQLTLEECQRRAQDNYLWGIERSGFFNGREKWAKGFENQRV